MDQRYTCQLGGVKGKQLLNMFKEYSKGMIYRHSKKLLDGELNEDKRSESGICLPSKLNGLDYQNIKKAITMLQETEGLLT